MKRAAWVLFGTVALSAMSLHAAAQDSYPASPIRIVWGYPPGSRGDLIDRLLAQKLSAQMNANVFIDSKPGAGGNIAAELVAKSKPDGYTLLYHPANLTIYPALGEKLGYDLLRDLAPVALVASGPQLMVVHPAMPSTVAEFIAYAKANPDKLAYGSVGTGSLSHLAPLLFLQSNNLSALHVPYKGTPAANIDLVAGRIQFGIVDVGSVLPLIKEKRAKALAITSLKRSPLLPDVPTLAETLPGFEIGNWFGVMAPARTPRAIIERLSSEIGKALQDADVMARVVEYGALPLASTPDEYAAYLRSELERWGKVIRSAGVKVE